MNFRPDYELRGPFRPRTKRLLRHPAVLVATVIVVAFNGLLIGMLRGWW
jgi:hypothetical protein